MEINVEYYAICRSDIKNPFGPRLRLLVHCWYILTHPIDGEYVGKASIMFFCHHGDYQQWEQNTQNELKDWMLHVEFKSGYFDQINICHTCVRVA